MIYPVVVAHNLMKPLTHAFWPLGTLKGCNPNAVVSGFFIAPTTTVLHTIASVQPDGVEEKGYTVCNCVIDDDEAWHSPRIQEG